MKLSRWIAQTLLALSLLLIPAIAQDVGKGKDFSGKELQNRDLRREDLLGANLAGANLTAADMTDTQRSIILGTLLMRVVGAEVLKSAVEALGDSIAAVGPAIADEDHD